MYATGVIARGSNCDTTSPPSTASPIGRLASALPRFPARSALAHLGFEIRHPTISIQAAHNRLTNRARDLRDLKQRAFGQSSATFRAIFPARLAGQVATGTRASTVAPVTPRIGWLKGVYGGLSLYSSSVSCSAVNW